MCGDIMEINGINIISLAYLGDSIYEVYVRENLLNCGFYKVNDMQKEAVKYVSARAQAKIVDDMIDNNILSEEEIDVYKRGRKYKRGVHPKSTDIITYKKSTGFEALIGYLYLKDKVRLKEILEFVEVK